MGKMGGRIIKGLLLKSLKMICERNREARNNKKLDQNIGNNQINCHRENIRGSSRFSCSFFFFFKIKMSGKKDT